MWDLLGGMGKSWVVATIGLMLLLTTEYNMVHFVYATEALKIREMQELDDYWIKSNTSGRVHYHTDFNFQMNEGDVIISDEADYLMFNDTEGFFDKAR